MSNEQPTNQEIRNVPISEEKRAELEVTGSTSYVGSFSFEPAVGQVWRFAEYQPELLAEVTEVQRESEEGNRTRVTLQLLKESEEEN
jgi:hypothetical protein